MGWDRTGLGRELFLVGWDKIFFVERDGTKSLWDGSFRSHAKPGPGPGWDKALVGWELPSRSRGQPTICSKNIFNVLIQYHISLTIRTSDDVDVKNVIAKT